MPAQQPTLDGTLPPQAPDYHTWADTIRPHYLTACQTGREWTCYEIAEQHELPEPPNPRADWGNFVKSLSATGSRNWSGSSGADGRRANGPLSRYGAAPAQHKPAEPPERRTEPREENMDTPFYTADKATLHLGDSLNILPTLPDASIDAIVCDPPYEIGFMDKAWDASGIAYNVDLWCQCWRVLKPGGHLLAFGGTRTYHRMTVAIEDADFEIRDSLHWIYGGGFPKGINVAKAIDRVGGSSPKEQAAVLKEARRRAGLTAAQVAEAIGCSITSVRNWEDGRARAAGREVEHIVPSPAYRERLADLLGYSADERLIVGASPRLRDKDGPVFKLDYSGVEYGAAATPLAQSWAGWNTALKPAHEPIVLARKPLTGTVTGNVLAHGTGALNVDGCRTEAGQDYRDKCASVAGLDSNRNRDAYGEWTGVRENSAHAAGRWPTNVLFGHGCEGSCAPGCPVGDLGGEARFFPVFRYEAKAPTSERPRLPDGTAHTTVKPLTLIRWLVRLVCPPGGTVLDPFAGSGTTLEACLLEGFTAVGVEKHEPYARLCVGRLSKPIAPSLFA